MDDTKTKLVTHDDDQFEMEIWFLSANIPHANFVMDLDESLSQTNVKSIRIEL